MQKPPESLRSIALCSSVNTRLGERDRIAAARTVNRASAVSTAASAPFPHTSPRTTPQASSRISKTS